MGPPPVVTGVSPKEGPPGTRVTIRGEFLGSEPNDVLSITICGSDCLLSADWKSTNKIIARSGPGKGRGDIIVTTRSGGIGTSTVQFRGYHETIGPLKESAVWVEEAPLQTLEWGRRSLSPTSYQMEDPLGLSVEGNDKKFPEDDLHELFPEGSGDLASDQFEPGWFLLEHHHATSFDDLRVGLSFLRRKVETHKEGQLSFLKANVGSVMEQLDMLFLLKEKFEADVQEHGVDPTIKMETAIKESINEANKLFEGVLSRRERADATRNALGVLQRFRFLFSLPVTIERNIKRGEYDAVINDYARANNLFGKTDVAVFKKVLDEVELRIDSLREMLRAKLQETPISLEQQKKLIRNCVNIEAMDDPSWEAISFRAQSLTEQLNACREAHITAEAAQQDTGLKHVRSGGSAKQLRTPSGNQQTQDLQGSIPQRVLCVEELTETVSQSFPDLWKLGQAYFSGELQVAARPSRQQDYKEVVLSVMQLLCRLVRGAILPQTLLAAHKAVSWPTSPSPSTPLLPWLPQCLRHLRSTYACLIALDLPADALDIVAALIFDLRFHCLVTSLRSAAEQVKSLHLKENWQLQFENSHGGITELPKELESIVSEVVSHLKESVLQSGLRETPLLDNELSQKELATLLQTLLLNYIQCLETLALHSDDGDHSPAVSQLIGSPAHYRNQHHSGLVWEQRLLATLSNCRYTEHVVLAWLRDLLARHHFPPLLSPDPFVVAMTALAALEARLTEAYLETKSDPLVGTIEPSMYLGRFEWDTERSLVDIRPYAKEIINNIIAVHAEVERICPELVELVLYPIVETVSEELSRLMSCVTRFSMPGTEQARTDMSALQLALEHYTTDHARGFFTEAVESIPSLTTQGHKNVEEVLSKFRSRMRLQLMCFNGQRL